MTNQTRSELTLNELDSRSRQTFHEIEQMSRDENVPYTQNEHYYFHHLEKYLEQYRLIRRQSDGQSSFVNALHSPNPETDQEHHINKVLAHLASLGARGVVAADLSRVLPLDDLDPALSIMAEVRSYFQGGSLPRTST